MIVKVCGITSNDNLVEISVLDFAMIGFNFYPQSKRYISSSIGTDKTGFRRVGVFVKANLATIKKTVEEHQLDYIQLHGDETVDFCQSASIIAPVIKVFRVDESFDFNICDAFSGTSKYFLFDTFTSEFGGSGKKFDWSTLSKYAGQTEFILSGGISNEDIEALCSIRHPKFIGVDINSRFETAPGIKDFQKLKQFKHGILRNSTLPTTDS